MTAPADSGATRFRKFDAGKGLRPSWSGGDCQVRALSVATGLKYGAAWDLLYRLQGKHRTPGFDLIGYLDHDPDELGVVRRISLPPVRGSPRTTVEGFCASYPAGSFILRLSHHVVAVEDGCYYDKFDCGDRCVYVAWEVRSHNGR
jgi:hypothetical protein